MLLHLNFDKYVSYATADRKFINFYVKKNYKIIIVLQERIR